jgi:hypothetical protein
MKRLTPPSEPRLPEVSVVVETEEALPQPMPTLKRTDVSTIADMKLVDVPPAKYGSVNLKKYSSFQTSRSEIKVHNQEVLAMQQLKSWLSSIDVELNMMNLELIADIASFNESFFVYGSGKVRRESIRKCTLEAILPYCKDDLDMAQALLLSVEHKIIKSTKLSRRLTRLRNFLYMATEIASRIFVKA